MWCLALECEHEVYTDIQLRNQYPGDTHYIFCPRCKEYKDLASPGKPYALCWTKVIEVNEVSDVPEWTTLIVPDEILRLQPGAPRSRSAHPFPYVKGIRNTGGIKSRIAGRTNKKA